MRIAVAYAEAKRQVLTEFDIPEGTTVGDAINKSGILGKFPEIDLTTNKVGIHGKIAATDQVLQQGDRVEIYRPAMGKPPKKTRDAAKKTTEDDDTGTDET
ncbi:MAG: RnfH family protein [Magnetococcus sp. DMHC-1]|nr:RnfH family protein [Magnetococcales bacterium]